MQIAWVAVLIALIVYSWRYLMQCLEEKKKQKQKLLDVFAERHGRLSKRAKSLGNKKNRGDGL